MFVGRSHTLKILVVSQSLKVSIDQHETNLVVVLRFELVDLLVSRVKLSVTASCYSNLCVEVSLVVSHLVKVRYLAFMFERGSFRYTR